MRTDPVTNPLDAQLALLPQTLQEELRKSFESPGRYFYQGSQRKTIVPRTWAANTKRMFVRTVYDAMMACRDIMPVNGIADLVTIQALNCFRNKVKTGTWNHMTLTKILSQLRTLARILSDVSLPHIALEISYARRQPPRYKNDRVLESEQWIEQGQAVFSLGEIACAAGKPSGETLQRNGALLALASDVALRAGEMAALQIEDLVFSHASNNIDVSIAAKTSKGRRAVVKTTSDERTYHMMRILLSSYRVSVGPLFFSRNGKPLTSAHVQYIIRRTTKYCGDVCGSANILRRSAVKHLADEREIRRQLGHSPTSFVGTSVYCQPNPREGNEICTSFLEQLHLKNP
ncbi:site-specific integrase [Acetobacter senegalensis]|uniref:site-specific integrase n=1 Tax=Acetobacter senegalensis TaxID=446692 RepID=UPI0026552FF1|nr:site-specific integrase [Acetobacter senegalensis]MDN7352151.1 site-specific integrase [Acetobacter senegalensis]